MPFRGAADVLQHPVPIDAGKEPETIGSHTLQVLGKTTGDAGRHEAAGRCRGNPHQLGTDFIRSWKDGDQPLGGPRGQRFEGTGDGGRQVLRRAQDRARGGGGGGGEQPPQPLFFFFSCVVQRTPGKPWPDRTPPGDRLSPTVCGSAWVLAQQE